MKRILRLFFDMWEDLRFKYAVTVLTALVLLSILSIFSPYDPYKWYVLPTNQPPSLEHILGTDGKGQDIFWLLTFSLKNSLILATIAAVFSRIIAITIGMLSGYLGGTTDRILMALTDTFMVMPVFPLLLLLSSLIKNYLSLPILGLIIGVFGWAGDARVIRSMILSLREREFVVTSKFSGMRTFEVVFGDFVPYLIPVISGGFIGSMMGAIGFEIVLAILGFTRVEIPTLGSMFHWMINFQAMLLGYWWWVLTPIVTAVFLFTALYTLSLSINEYLDPRTRMQRIGAVK
ncbi:MAG TPA: ABC transporter permease [Thermotoga sp.]|jgi:peptide/nickel transport system permease protein|uniref:Oligopeptide ABC transporter, permease protein n=1 Tax=Thermotoga maritima (strain ATCC 43589 / DSM 3109 / JCM 10099 / NBRC 100826 / MSB8) TaxID=243274 RepID=Q9WYD8_THEMA|nr:MULTISPECIES: ABC transporter permease [Thermotoga]HBF69414.1 ABC transporter permease [Thermotoga sp.]AAD35390.1 oligopeptide ABC transporter, permease protein [Thermotoga maritima MSB8]ACB08982.1 binding-protein-dependent transport systems inner membrane component [Thermotoga sp. RQ2]AGL49226.1 Xyloglucan ABC transport system, permease protein 2 [Thermotoga maritima MSB8]AKE26241.1 peptide ABC transporter [Thermotoga maritima]